MSEGAARPITESDYVEGVGNSGITEPTRLAPMTPGLAVVTGASSGIGWDTTVALRAAGWDVIAVARRADRLAALAKVTGCYGFVADLAVPEQVEALADYAQIIGPVRALVNNAGGAIGLDSVAEGNPEGWAKMYEMNVLTALNTTKAFLPGLRERGGDVVFVTSIAALDTYPNGAGYTGAKHAEAMLPRTLRLELLGEPVRIIEICPGLVQTPEFTLNRTGDVDFSESLYQRVNHPLAGADIAEGIVWALGLPPNVNIDQMVIKPVEQSNGYTLKRLDQPIQ
ncbi:SDR family oxidoreductase [Stomatohabitans albus]|uniref:SDR family oxidoreductase n=1 Tax=Stomatohabitans albus TaxID=3110766 RepID=UPI003AB9A734